MKSRNHPARSPADDARHVLDKLKASPNAAVFVPLPRGAALRSRFMRVRALTEQIAHGLSDADASIQAVPYVSPAKWHLAHTSWFFETFVLREYCAGYAPFAADYHFLFNSYYESAGSRLERHQRGLLSRPALPEVLEYRYYVSKAVLRCVHELPAQALDLLELGCNHEEQHQELLQTDVLYLFGCNPLLPAWWPGAANNNDSADKHTTPIQPIQWVKGARGPAQIGHHDGGFAFDCERPSHTLWLAPHALANRLISNAEWREFIDDGGYRNPALWLADGWEWVQSQPIESPLYWQQDEGGQWNTSFGPSGKQPLNAAAPVSHVSYYEADAYARWSGARLPTEAEWETAATHLEPHQGNFLDSAGPARPHAAQQGTQLQQMFGELWQWTASAFLPYPGFRTAAGAVGEYNGKFMSGQFVLRGGSCATPRGHMRASYRNFFYPQLRWQYTGVRLAKDL